MELLLVLIFILGYLAIVFEHPLHVNKAAPAILTGVLTWTIYALSASDIAPVNQALSEHLAGIAEILFFLMGAMTIVEVVDAHQGFKVLTDRIKTRDARKLLWIISFVTFFLSAVLDNLTTAIVMVSLLRKLIKDKQQRMFFAGMVVVAANAGGAWSPIGDVTTTMLWIANKISATNIMVTLIIPSLVCTITPLVYLSFTMKGKVKVPEESSDKTPPVHGRIMLILGIVMLLFVPVFKSYTHLPPYLGMLFALGIVWLTSELMHVNKAEQERKTYSAVHALSKIDVPSILFFLGILLAITTLESTEILHHLAVWLDKTLGSTDLIAFTIGLLSAVVDNVPLVAAAMNMYDFPMDHKFWEFIAFAAGTGGSCLIIGSAAGVAVMGMEKMDFIWYLKKVSWLALIGYIGGCLAYLAVYPIFAVH